MIKADVYKEWIECKNEEEVKKAEKLLREKGYDLFDIYVGRYEGNDNRFHREVFVFK